MGNNGEQKKIDIRQMSRDQVAYVVGNEILKRMGSWSKKKILEKFAIIYGGYMARCSDEAFEKEIEEFNRKEP